MHPLLGLTDPQNQGSLNLPLTRLLELLGNSIALGLILMFIAIWVIQKLRGGALNGAESKLHISEVVLSAGNYLFLTVGMTGVMLLVNDNLARAFAIGAAISLVRLRIKVDGKGQGTTLLFAVLVGMACGVEKVLLAWGLTGIFALLQFSIINYVAYSVRKNPPPVPPAAVGSTPGIKNT